MVTSISPTLLSRVSRFPFLRKAAGTKHAANVLLNDTCGCVFQFEGTEGEWFQKLTARFCSHQSWALDQIKNRQKKEPRFNSFILVA